LFRRNKKHNGKGVEMNYTKIVSATLAGQDQTSISVKIQFQPEDESPNHDLVVILPKPRTFHGVRHVWFESPLVD